jgi:LuxR family maltose regulon positive regulatory protein
MGWLARAAGRPEEAAAICRAGQAAIWEMLHLEAGGGQRFDAGQAGDAAAEAALPALGCLDIVLGWVHLDEGRLGEAERALLHGLELAGYGANPYPVALACLALFRLREIQGRPEEALAYLARLEQAWPDVTFCARGLAAVHELQAASHDLAAPVAARAWAGSFAASLRGSEMPAFGVGPLGAAQIYYTASLAWARCEIAAGNPHAARAYLQRQTALAQARGLAGRLAELTALAAEGASSAAPPRPATQTGEQLSDRELEVLRLMARGATNQQIAGELVITVGTVKSHINHILGKLAARNRTEAVARARRIGLLHG